MKTTHVAAAIAVLCSTPLGAQANDRFRLSIYAGPESSGFKGDSEAAMQSNGYNVSTPPRTDCGIIPAPCGGGSSYPNSNSVGTESFMLSLSYRMGHVAFDAIFADGTAGETAGHKFGGVHDSINFSEAIIVGAVVAFRADALRLGIGPASMTTMAGLGANERRQRRPGMIVDGELDIYHWRSMVGSIRAQYRTFGAMPVVTVRGERYDVAYRSIYVALGVGLQR